MDPELEVQITLRKLIDYAIRGNSDKYHEYLSEQVDVIEPDKLLELSNATLHVMLTNEVPFSKKELGPNLKNLESFIKKITPVSRATVIDILRFLNQDSNVTEVDAEEALIIIPNIIAFLLQNTKKDKVNIWDILNIVQKEID